MIENGLPTREDAYAMGTSFKQILGNQEFFLFPLDWGASRVADLIMEEVEPLGLSIIRYDLPIRYSSNGSYRQVTKSGPRVRDDLEHGVTVLNLQQGLTYTPINPVNFEQVRPAVMFDDWAGFTGQALVGGLVWAIDNSDPDRLNLGDKYPGAMKAFAKIELPPRYGGNSRTASEIIIPNAHPVVDSYRRMLAEGV